MWMPSPIIPNPSPGAWLPLAGQRSRSGNDHKSTAIIVTGDGLQVCLPLSKEVGDRKVYCLRQGTLKRGRRPANQPIKQASNQSGKQAGRQAGRQKHIIWLFFSCGLRLQTLGNPWCAGTISGRVVKHSANKPPSVSLNPGRRDRPVAGSANWTPQPFFILDPCSNPSDHKL